MNIVWIKKIILPVVLSIFSVYLYGQYKGWSNPSACSCEKQSKAAAILASSQSCAPENMVEVPSGIFKMGGQDPESKPDEGPLRDVTVTGFYMDMTEVTNEQFEKFTTETGYVTTAEKPVDWEVLKLQLPPNTPKPPAEKLAPGSLVFIPPNHPVDLRDASQWWRWVNGANWRASLGAGSKTFGKDHPVVHVSWEDANSYCKWRGKRLPSEAEREWAARGGLENKIYPWGNDAQEIEKKANIWQGSFPYKSTKPNNDYWTTPVRFYPPNKYGLYDMVGNVWEWTADLYDANFYERSKAKGSCVNPCNAEKSFDPEEPLVKKYTLRGGSFLCSNSYCTGYRVSARMKNSPDTSLINTGFRCVKDLSVK